ncbi:uncharacterized protein LOC133920529 [Phragmites australis]|uniref:uncharacterized protein LOC133920529 n=1 Tax=Phragmites australis TaxID=29695 RepID=UPI002D79654A|nr:uncharacterized protein LOC133920529 [Phragmites australis]
MENRRRQATRRARCLLALAADYLKYLFMKRRRLLHKVARRTLALIHRHGERKNRLAASSWSSRALMEYEFSCGDSPGPAFLAVKRLLRSRLKGGGAAAAGAVSSCFGSLLRAPCGSPETTAAETEAAEDEDQVETEGDEEDRAAAEDRWVQCCELLDVDDRAEEFINMFYEQLRAQSFAAVFQCSP